LDRWCLARAGDHIGRAHASEPQRLRQGKHHITLLVNQDEIDFLLERG
jgi:hypothetical protein